VNESGLFSDPELTAIFAVISAIVLAFKLSISSLIFNSLNIVAQDNEESVEEVVVTGSYIKGSPTDGASPVEIIKRDEIDNLNASTIADITANIAVNSGSENNPDSFTQGATQGTSNIN
jgi:iron complex outermembrane receptor protein